MRSSNGRRHRKNYGDFVHTGPGTLAGRYLRMFWQPVYRGEDLAPGRAVPIRIMGEDFTLYRGESGNPYLVGFRCAHRGTKLSVGWVENDCIRCFYHGWKYDSSGQCIEQPGEGEAFAGKVKIPSWPVAEALGLIFGYFGEHEPPPLPVYLDLEGGVLTVYPPEAWPCNYFNRLENDCDSAHVPFTHRLSRSVLERHQEVSTITCEETEYGISRNVVKASGEARENSFYMPNVSHIRSALRKRVTADAVFSGHHNRLLWRVPIDDEHSLAFTVDIAQIDGDGADAYRGIIDEAKLKELTPRFELAEAVLEGKLKLTDVKEQVPTYALSHIEDYISLVGQGSIADRKNERLGRMDVGVILLRKLWERELRALSQGRGLKKWTLSGARPSEAPSTTANAE